MAKECSRCRESMRPSTVTTANGQFGTGNPKVSLNSQSYSIRRIPDCTKFFNLSLGRFRMGPSMRREGQRSTSKFGRTIKANFTLFTSNNAIPALNPKTSDFRSSSRKLSKGDSLRRQTALAEEYAQKHGLELDGGLTVGVASQLPCLTPPLMRPICFG